MTSKQIIDKLNELLIGMTIDQTKIILAQNSHRFGTINKIRKSDIDGVSQVCTAEFRQDRLNVSIKGNKITNVISIG